MNENKEQAATGELAARYAEAKAAIGEGEFGSAEKLLRSILDQSPGEMQAHFLLGNLYLRAQRYRQALRSFDQALESEPQNLSARLNRANALIRLDRLPAAEKVFREVLDEHPDLAVAHFNLGLLLKADQKAEEAVISFQQALQFDSGLLGAYRHLADLLKELGRKADAAATLQQLASQAPGDVELLDELGGLLSDIGAYDQAENAYRAALQQAPDSAALHYSLGSVLQFQQNYNGAIESFRGALRLDPKSASYHTSLGNCLHQVGDVAGARSEYQAALDLDPTLAHARFALCINLLKVVYRSEQEILDSRAAYGRELDNLHDYYKEADEEERARAADAVGFLQPFFLAYQGLPVRKLQQRYAQTIRMLMKARHPEFDKTLPMTPAPEKIRLGIVSGFFRNHSAWNHFQGMFEALDRSRVEIILFYTQTVTDRETQLVKNLADGFIQGPMDTGQWARTIREQNLHALLFPEFGMDPMTIRLGCLRLAPIQLTCWGHPVTSGLDTIDYFLSSDLMEPGNGQDDYSEQLVRLPRLGMHYRLPTVNPPPLERSDLDLPENGVMYWCCQSLFKYMPRHDDIFPRIAQELDDAFFVFIEGTSDEVTDIVKERLSSAFGARGLDMEKHCFFLSRLPKPSFAAVTAMADVFLDSVDWSGCNSAMEAIAADRPLLTLPGDFMRGRHSTAFLKLMEMDEWIADGKEKFIAMAIRLGRNPDLRKSAERTIAERKHLLYRDQSPARAFEDLLQQAIEAYEPKTADTDRSKGFIHHLERRVADFPEDRDVHWELARHYQRKEEFEKAVESFARGIEQVNSRYADAEAGPCAAPDGKATVDNGHIELAGLRYPRIPPLPKGVRRPYWSVVIPACNRKSYLLECLASVLAEWRGDDHMEIIVIDNGSDPPLEPWVEAIGKGIVRYHYHPETIPLQRNWNSAVNVARGHWIHLLHDDDYVLPGFYAALEKGLRNAPESVLAAFTAYENIDENDRVIYQNRVLGSRRGLVENWIWVIGQNNVLNPPAVVINRKAYEEVGGYNEDILYTIDWELYMRIASLHDWFYEPEILVRYRQHRENVTAEQSAAGSQGEAFWRAIEMSEHYLPAEHSEQIIQRARRYHFQWALQRLRLPLQAGNIAGSHRLMREMLRIDDSNESASELFDWLATSFAGPLWPGIKDTLADLPGDCPLPGFSSDGELFAWLAGAEAANVRTAIASLLKGSETINQQSQEKS